MMMAVSRRAVKSVPAQMGSRARRSASARTGVSGSPEAGVLIPAVAFWSASPSLWSQRQNVPDAGEPSSRGVAGVVLADLDQPASDVLALQLGRSDLGMVLGQPVGQAPHRVLVGLDGVVGVAVSP
jgi:hypothetical protein